MKAAALALLLAGCATHPPCPTAPQPRALLATCTIQPRCVQNCAATITVSDSNTGATAPSPVPLPAASPKPRP